MLSADGKQRFGIRVELGVAVGKVYDGNEGEHHPLVAGGKVVQKLLDFLSHLLQLIGNGRGEIVVQILLALPARDVRFYRKDAVLHFLDRFIGGDGKNVDRKEHLARKVSQLGYHAVLDKGGVVFEKQHSAVLFPDTEMPALELHAVGADIVLKVVTALHGRFQVKVKILLLAATEKVVEYAQAVIDRQFTQTGGNLTVACGKVAAYTVEKGSCFLDILFLHGNGDVLFLDDVMALCGLVQQICIVFGTVAVPAVLHHRHQNGAAKGVFIQAAVINADFRFRVGFQRVEYIAVSHKHFQLVVAGGDGIVNIKKAEGL